MGQVIIQPTTTTDPITMIGYEAGICWGSDTTDAVKNFKRGLDCLESQHGRTFEFPDVYMVLDGYSARVIREWYTHIGGMPTRLQASTRYIDYEHGFDYVVPKSISEDVQRKYVFESAIAAVQDAMRELDKLGTPREDSAMLLPLAMETKIVCKHNLRNLIDMSHQRMCARAYHEYRDELFRDVCDGLRNYSDEWKYIVENYFQPKCEYLGYCPEKKSCGRTQKK